MNKKEELINTFNALKTALKNNDAGLLGEIISDEYKGCSLNGTIETKTDILNTFSPGGVQLTEYMTENIEFDVCGDMGIITGKGIVAGKFQEFSFTHNVMFTDIFKFTMKGWKYYKSQVTEIRSV